MPRALRISLSAAPLRRISRTSNSRRVRFHFETKSVELPPVWGDFFTRVLIRFPLREVRKKEIRNSPYRRGRRGSAPSAHCDSVPQLDWLFHPERSKRCALSENFRLER